MQCLAGCDGGKAGVFAILKVRMNELASRRLVEKLECYRLQPS